MDTVEKTGCYTPVLSSKGCSPCPYAKWKRCPECGPKNGLCKVRACEATRKPLLLGYTPPVGLLERPREAGAP